MMSKKQLACMLTLHIIYLLLGASIFYHIESPLEMQQRVEEKLERLEIQNLLYENYIPTDPDKQDNILRKLSEYCGKSMLNYTTEEEEPPIKWDFYHSFYFSYTVVSTIGYGNLAPTTHLSRILMIFYGLFGIPINGILLANLGEYFGMQLIKVYRKYKRRSEKRADMLDYFFHNLGMLGQIFLYLVPGFLFFIFLPSCIFVVFEGWDFVAAIYYAFVTLTTIGFGDIVAGTANNGFAYGYFVVYQIFQIVWITFGLGYIVMLLGFITSGMRSEGVHKLEQKLAYQFKSTQNRILQGFTRDIATIRKIINEANLIKLKPVYVEQLPRLCRSSSCPEFTFNVEPRGPITNRRRANSENIQISCKDILRIQSDTDLLGIDKEKTFTASAIVKPAELLARVVNVLGNYEDEQIRQEKGVNMFKDSEILDSEKPSHWNIGNNAIMNSPNSLRNRALSIAVPNYRKEYAEKYDNDYTWTNGDNPDKYMSSIVRNRPGKMSLPTENIAHLPKYDDNQPKGNILTRLFRKSSSTENPTEHLKDSPKETQKVRDGSIVSASESPKEIKSETEIPNRRRHSIFPTFDFNQSEDEIAKTYKEKTKRGRHSIFPTFDFSENDDDSMAKAYKEKTKRGRHSIFPTFDFNENDDDNMAKAYKEKTKRGRHSIFPTFDFSENDEDEKAKTYKEKTKRGRHSIFPTFDFNEEEDDDDMAKQYKEITKRGRRSIFPTFNFNEKKSNDEDSLNEEEIKSYQNRTKKGRGSLFPTFGRSKKDDADIETNESEEIQRYKNKTTSGRSSLFPSFGKTRKNSSSDDSPFDLSADIKKFQNKHKKSRSSVFSGDTQNSYESPEDSSRDLENYLSKSKRGRGSLFDPDVNIAELPQKEQAEVLEHTSVADLLRALAILESATPSQSAHAPASLSSLVDIISGSNNSPASAIPGHTLNKTDLTMPSISQVEESSTGNRRRRISARAAAPQFTPTLATVMAGAELQTTALSARENRMTMIAYPPPPYSENAADQQESSQPRVRRYSPASGGPSVRLGSGPVSRLSSRNKMDGIIPNIDAGSSRRGSLTDVVVDDNKNKT